MYDTMDSRGGKKPYQAPQIVVMGRVTEIVRGGGGKLSVTGADPGDIRKPKGQA